MKIVNLRIIVNFDANYQGSLADRPVTIHGPPIIGTEANHEVRKNIAGHPAGRSDGTRGRRGRNSVAAEH
jgi:hypothetical protein